MYKAISILLASAAVLTVMLTSCQGLTGEEETTDNVDKIIATIDKSSPITKGNLITKTDTDEDGNLNVNYYDSDGNLVENFVWDDDEKIAHSIMTYSDTDLLMQKEDISPDGTNNRVESYQYDADGNVLQKTVNEFENSVLTKSTTYDAEGKETGHSISYYNDNSNVTKTERFDGDGELEEYYMYEYNDDGKMSKYSAFDSDGNLEKYTTFEYNDNGLVSTEKYFDSDNELEEYYVFDYYEDGNMKYSANYDSDGNLVSQDYFDKVQ